MVSLWKFAGQGSGPLTLPDMSSLDSITRQLPGGFYTSLRTYRNRTHALGLRAHLDRLYRPLTPLRIEPAVDRLQLRWHLSTLLASFPPGEARLRLVLATQDVSGAVYVAIEPFQPLPLAVYLQGVRVLTMQARRDHPALKSTTFIGESQHQRRQLLEGSIFEGLIVQNGHILEGLTSNFFYMVSGKLGTARRGILNGVTRRQVLRLARENTIEVIYRAIQAARASDIDEAFLTSSSRGVVPIVTIDGVQIGSGGVGRGTQRLMHLYEADVETQLEPIY